MPAAADVDRLLTTAEAAEVLSVDPETVREWLREGHLNGTKVGTAWRVPASAIFDADGQPRPQIGPNYN